MDHHLVNTSQSASASDSNINTHHLIYDAKDGKGNLEFASIMKRNDSISTDQKKKDKHKLDPTKPIFIPGMQAPSFISQKDQSYGHKRLGDCKHYTEFNVCLNGLSCKNIHNYKRTNLPMQMDYIIGSIARIQMNQELILNTLAVLCKSSSEEMPSRGRSASRLRSERQLRSKSRELRQYQDDNITVNNNAKTPY